MKKGILILGILILYFGQLNSGKTGQIDDFELCMLEGFTLLTCSRADDEFEGEDGEIVRLYNGMTFRIDSYSYQYQYGPQVVVFGRIFNIEGEDHVFYKLVSRQPSIVG